MLHGICKILRYIPCTPQRHGMNIHTGRWGSLWVTTFPGFECRCVDVIFMLLLLLLLGGNVVFANVMVN